MERVFTALVSPVILLCFVEIITSSFIPFYSILRAESEFGTFGNRFAVSQLFFGCKLRITFNGVCLKNKLDVRACHAPLAFEHQRTVATSLSALLDACSAKPTGVIRLMHSVRRAIQLALLLLCGDVYLKPGPLYLAQPA